MKKTNLKLKADRIFSKFVRLSHADSAGFCICYTCGKRFHWKEMDNGHFKARRKLATRYEIMNCKPQCTGCNKYKAGDLDVFAVKLEEEYGYGVLQELQRMTVERLYATKPEQQALFKEIIEYYEPRVKEMERGIL